MFDSHCHLQDERQFPDVEAVLARAAAAGVTRLLLAGVDAEDWAAQRRLVERRGALVSSYGLHPQRVAALDDQGCDRELMALEAALLSRPPALVAIGEVGLDGVGARQATLARQERLFVAQLELAARHRLPVALHILRQHPRALALLGRASLPAGGVVHSYSGSAELARDYLALGLHLSFSGALTWADGRNRAVRAVRGVAPERLLVETDAPDQTPEPERGRLGAVGRARNEPAFLVAIVAAVAHIWGVDAAVVARVTDENARRLFLR